jgi:hypothetical protein
MVVGGLVVVWGFFLRVEKGSNGDIYLLLRSLCVCVFFLTLVSFSTFFYFFSTFSTRNKGLSATSYEGETKGDFPDGGDSNPQGGVEEEDEFTNELETHNRWVKSKEECSFSFFFFFV